MFPGSFKGVSRRVQACFKDVSKSFKKVKDVSRQVERFEEEGSMR